MQCQKETNKKMCKKILRMEKNEEMLDTIAFKLLIN
jgi:hypothetical protein